MKPVVYFYLMVDALHISYLQTSSFNKIVVDYLDGAEDLRSFYVHPVNMDGIQQAINARQSAEVNRPVLTTVLKKQYAGIQASAAVLDNIDRLQNENVFTVCTAHQPNLLTGPLYFIYKILHAIKLAADLSEKLPGNYFIPVFYMGSEDADLAELNHFTLDGKRYEWKTKQTGAVGRMRVDKFLLVLINELEGQLSVAPFGTTWMQMVKQFFTEGVTIEQATLQLVNALFGRYGLVVLIADDKDLKQQMLPVFKKDIFEQGSSTVVEETCRRLQQQYNVQAHPREINLFYLKDDLRARIEKQQDRFFVVNTEIEFSGEELNAELMAYPERFSPNVILRGLYQESILPNIAFIGGGGELAYWLQLKDLFQHYKVPFPVLVLRNSFLLVENKWSKKIASLGLTMEDIFMSENNLMKKIVHLHSQQRVSLNGQLEQASALFSEVVKQAAAIDITLTKHVAAIAAKTIKTLQQLEKKMLRAEKRKFGVEQKQLSAIKQSLFPGNGLQERKENVAGFYSKCGEGLLDELLHHSLALEQKFTVLTFSGQS